MSRRGVGMPGVRPAGKAGRPNTGRNADSLAGMAKRVHPTPADLHRELGRIRQALLDLRVDTQHLAREFVWLSADGLDVEDAESVLREARDGLDVFGGALGLATDAVNLSLARTDRLT